MSLSEPKPKKNSKLKPSQPLPLLKTNLGVFRQFKASFNGFCVTVDDYEEMKILISMGYFGKATMSRNYPNFQHHNPEVIRKRVFQHRKRYAGSENGKIIVLPDSDSDGEYFTNFKPEYQIDNSGITEVVNLGLEEAFFLMTAISCLQISYEGEILDVMRAWNVFQQSDRYFVQNYIVYCYFRARNWIVKPGIKFGGDFLLYKQGPPFFHASYVVIIHVVDENMRTIEHLNRRSSEYSCLAGLHRLCETAGKELLICEIIWPYSSQDEVSFDNFSTFSLKQTLMRRWISSQERQTEGS